MKQPFHRRFFLDAAAEREAREKRLFSQYPTPLPYAPVVNKYPAVYRGSMNRVKRKSTFIEMRST